jgi:hypothetical protein
MGQYKCRRFTLLEGLAAGFDAEGLSARFQEIYQYAVPNFVLGVSA